MKIAKRILQMFLVVPILIGLFFWNVSNTSAQSSGRETTIVVSYIEYEWWLISWQTNQVLCRFTVDQSGLPTDEDVLKSCGWDLYLTWRNTPPCEPIFNDTLDTTGCVGVYLHLASYRSAEKTILVELPAAAVWVTLEGCTPKPPKNLCPTIPNLLLIGEEPLPNEEITAVHGTFDGVPFTCQSDTCSIPLKPTSFQGITVEFWADSSYGDTSERYTAQVRVIDTGVPSVPGEGGWYVDVISSQWIGAPIATCARIWRAFPPVGEPPAWLSTPEQPELLASGEGYYYLAGRLISQGLVDVDACTTGGLLPNGYADACGVDQAAPILVPWQNQFDESIIIVAIETGIPAQLLKNLFAQESQFWPGMFRVPYEFGLGQITDNGADSILLWNETFYEQFCPLVLAEETCHKGYLHLNDKEQRLLRGAVAVQANSDCAECPTGIDLRTANYSVRLFASTLIANCAQVNQTIYNATKSPSGSVSTYQDLWRFTVANYHAGSGCVAFAIHKAWQETGVLNWEQVSTSFTAPCLGVVPYVEKITDLDGE